MTRASRSIQSASEEFTEAVHWYKERRSGLGAEFFDAVTATMALIVERPEVGTAIGAGGSTRRMLVGAFPYQVVYHLIGRLSGHLIVPQDVRVHADHDAISHSIT